MNPPTPQKSPTELSEKSWTLSFWVDFLGVLCIFFIYAGSTVPAINEPHYWTKAAHFWNSNFGKGDLFLESGDAHWLYFATFGYLTQCVPLVWAVWIGRFIIWILLAIGWTMLGRALWTKPSSLVASVWALVWLAGLHWGHWAGEWVVGGSESKGVAYAFIFMGLANAIHRNWLAAWTALGIAAAFHVVVGIWVIASVLCVSFLVDRESKVHESRWSCLRRWMAMHRAGWIVCFAGIMIGVIPVISIDWGTDPKLATESAVKQVYLRLGHHLAPSRFSSERWRNFGVQLLVAGLLTCVAQRSKWHSYQEPSANRNSDPKNRFLGNVFAETIGQWRSFFKSLPRGMQWIVSCGLFAFAMAFTGLFIDLTLGKVSTNLAAKLLRFYWFRWNDVAMPMMIGSIVVAFAYGKLVFEPNPPMFRKAAWLAASVPGILLLGYRFEANINEKIPAGEKANFVDKNDSEIEQVNQYRDWLRVCDWIRGNTDQNALWLTPRRQQSFKWNTGRAELACWKDAPQNAEALVHWDERRKDAYQFNKEKKLQPLTTDKLWELHKKYRIRYVLLDRRVLNQSPPLLPILYPTEHEFNDTFAVFEFPMMQENVSP